MKGPNCPNDQAPMEILSTKNEWVYYCPACRNRYNAYLQKRPAD